MEIKGQQVKLTIAEAGWVQGVANTRRMADLAVRLLRARSDHAVASGWLAPSEAPSLPWQSSGEMPPNDFGFAAGLAELQLSLAELSHQEADLGSHPIAVDMAEEEKVRLLAVAASQNEGARQDLELPQLADLERQEMADAIACYLATSGADSIEETAQLIDDLRSPPDLAELGAQNQQDNQRTLALTQGIIEALVADLQGGQA